MKISAIVLLALLLAKGLSAQTFTYDNANRLTEIAYNNGLTISYSYDKLGNRIDQVINASPLPIELYHFSASADQCSVNIRWLSGEQSSIQSYILERSENGSSFSPIATFLTKQDGSYEYTDQSLARRYQYYRLKMINKNNSYQYSRLLSVFTDCEDHFQFSAFPNPVVDYITVRFIAEKFGFYQLVFCDVQGKSVLTRSVNIQQKDNELVFSLKDLVPAQYYLRLISPGGEIVAVQKLGKL